MVLQEFYGPANTVDKRRQMLAHPIRAFGIKIKPTTFHGYVAIRMELYGYGKLFCHFCYALLIFVTILYFSAGNKEASVI